MNALITVTTNEQGSLVVSSLNFSGGLDIQHKNLLETIRTHQAIIEQDFGLIAFETEAVKRPSERGTKHQTVAYLTEDQALFIGTLSRNSKRVVEFKSVLVRSFAEARRLTASTSTDRLVAQAIQTINDQARLLAEAHQLIAQLRVDLNQLQSDRKLSKAANRPTAPKTLPLDRVLQETNLRESIRRHIDEYCSFHHADYKETYNYLYRRLNDVYGINVHRLKRIEGENLLGTIERYGQLAELYKLAINELLLTSE